MQRYIIENHGGNVANAKFMLSEAMRICQRDGMSRITLFVPNKGSFPSTVVGQFLGGVTKKLCKGEAVCLTENISLDLQSANKVRHICHYEMIVGVYLSLESLFKLESEVAAKAIIFLPWMEDEGKRWLATRNPTVLGANTWHVQHISLSSEVNNILSILTDGVNLSTGLAHPSDRKAAREALMKISDLGYLLNSSDVKNWAIQNGWGVDAANDLAKEAAKVFKRTQI